MRPLEMNFSVRGVGGAVRDVAVQVLFGGVRAAAHGWRE